MGTSIDTREIMQTRPEHHAGFTSPSFYSGQGTPDGDTAPLLGAAIGSIYSSRSTGAVYSKIADNGADADWAQVQAVLAQFSYLKSGTGVPAGTLAIADYPKGTIYVQTNAADDAVAIFVRVDDAGDAGDWKSLAYSA